MSDIKKIEGMITDCTKDISAVKERHRLELQPMEAYRMDLRAQLGVLRSGINIGDILEDAKGRRVMVSSIFASYGNTVDIRGINIKKA